ncbi:hypothetical protein K438DRAFT_2027209 [Mycena galopus ATCC 62051]|nr:hypothetical protein K438DRAFT_2027209 [Mycena galopus ATCC 62051]
MDSAAADRARLAEIDIEISSLERALFSLRERRAQVQERLDSCRYPVLTLPTEITSNIFINFLPVYPACPPLMGPSSPTLLTQICRHWRQIAVATPELWRAISFDKDHVVSLEEQLDLYHIWLARSRSYPLSIKFGGFRDEDAEEVLKAIAPHRARWEYLDVELAASDTHAVGGPMPLLRHLGLTVYDELEDVVTFSLVPLLRSIDLRAGTPSKFALPWAQLTSLTLQWASRDEYVEILQQTCNLVHCELDIVFNRNLDINLPPEHGIELPRLESLTFSEANVPDSSRYLDDFLVPALRSLRLSESYLRPKPIDRLSSFIANSGCKLLEVCVTGRTIISEASYREAFLSIRFSFDDESDNESDDSDATSISTDSS